MSKKTRIMSLSLEPEIKERLKIYSKQRTKGNISKAIKDLIEKYVIIDEEIIPVVLKIPSKLKDDPENLQKWLDIKVAVIIQALSA